MCQNSNFEKKEAKFKLTINILKMVGEFKSKKKISSLKIKRKI